MTRPAEWLASWRVALRLARRDSWSHKGRSLLVLVMIAVPVALMVGGLTVWATTTIDHREKVPRALGQAAAAITWRSGTQVAPTVDALDYGMSSYANPPKALPIPGIDPSHPQAEAQERQALSRYLGARLVPVRSASVATEIRGQAEPLSLLEADARDQLLRGHADLTSGRWPTTRSEIVITERGLRRGLPDHGTVTLTSATTTPRGKDVPVSTPVTVVGVGTATDLAGREDVDAVRLPDTDDASLSSMDGTYLVDRAAPVTWAEVQDGARHGLGLVSRAILLDPSLAGDDGVTEPERASARTTALVVTVLSAALLIESALLAGPAFAVIAQRQRRTLALAASNGATRAQLRRTVLATALVLGAASSVVAVALGVGVATLAMTLADRRWPSAFSFGPFDVPWLHVGIVLAVAILSAVAAAMLPARGLGRIDVAAALRGTVPPRRMRRSVPITGLLLAAAGTAGIFVTMPLSRRAVSNELVAMSLVVSAIVLVLGSLMAVPALLAVIGRLGARLPVPARMATRDAARQRGRATPTVAAIMAGSILLSASMLMASAATEISRRDYRPQAPLGWLYTDPIAPDEHQVAAVRAALPGASVHEIRRAAVNDAGPSDGQSGRSQVLTRPGCAPAQMTGTPSEAADPCPVMSADAPIGGGPILVLDPGQASDLMHLTANQRLALQRGGVLTTSTRLAEGGRATWRDVTWSAASETGEVSITAAHSSRAVPVATLGQEQRLPLADMSSQDVAIISPTTATALGFSTTADHLVAASPGGAAITADQERTVTAILWPQDDGSPLSILAGPAPIHVERGFVDPMGGWRWALLGLLAALILVATTTATALSMGESQRDLDTLTAVGSAGRTRHAIAATQAGLLGLVGTVVGLLVGAVPGIAFSLELTGSGGAPNRGSFVAVPWDLLGAALVVIPLLAAALATLVVRGRPTLTRRQA